MNEIKIIYEDNDILILDKPSGVIVNNSDTTKGEYTIQDYILDKFQIPASRQGGQNSKLTRRIIFIKERELYIE